MGPRSLGDEVALHENGTDKLDKVGLKDLAFWLPQTKSHLSTNIQYAPTFDALTKLPVAHIGFILSITHVHFLFKGKLLG